MKIYGMELTNGKEGKIDRPFLLIILTLVGIGLMMMFSASYANALYYYKDSTYFIKRQLTFAIIGIIAMFIASNFNFKILKRFSRAIYVVAIVLLVVVLILPKVNNVHRWIIIGPINFQPSEVAKFAIIVLFSAMIDKNYNKMSTFNHGILPFVCFAVPVLALMILEPHLSGSVIIIALCALMLWIGGADKRWFIAGIFLCAALALGILAMGTIGYASDRLSVWKDPFVDPLNDGYQTIQSLYAISSGGFYGTGIGGSRQKYLFLPEPQNDFIFAVVCEELGFVGAVIILLIFALLIYRGFTISYNCRDRFGMLLGMGLTGQIGIQTLLNICVVTNILPNTGISLPFFSYGGTSLVMLLGQVGLILSVSRLSSSAKE